MGDVLPFKKPEPTPPGVVFVTGCVVIHKDGSPPLLFLRESEGKILAAHVCTDDGKMMIQSFEPHDLIQIAPNWIEP